MKNYKQLLSLVLVLAMFLSLGSSAFAADLETAAEDSGYGASWDDWDDAPAEDPADEAVFEEPEVVEDVEEPEIPAFTEEPEAVDYPANEFFYVGGNGLRVTVKAPEGAFPADAVMTVNETKLEDAQKKIDASDLVDGVAFVAADISFTNAEGKLQPQEPVEVSITSSSAKDAGEPVVVHVNDAQELEIVGELAEFAGPGASLLTVQSAADACTYSFVAKSFSEYILVDQAPQSVSFGATDYQYVNNHLKVRVEVFDVDGVTPLPGVMIRLSGGSTRLDSKPTDSSGVVTFLMSWDTVSQKLGIGTMGIANDGNAGNGVKFSIDLASEATSAGYTLLSRTFVLGEWTRNNLSDGTGVYFAPGGVYSGDAGAYAAFSATVQPPLPKTVHFDTSSMSNGSDPAFADQTVAYNATATDPSLTVAPVNASDPDEIFRCWALQGSNTPYSFSTPVTGDITLVPLWGVVQGIIHYEIYYWDHNGYWSNPFPNSYHPNQLNGGWAPNKPSAHEDASKPAAQTAVPVNGLKFAVKTYPQGGNSNVRDIIGYIEPAEDSNTGTFYLNLTPEMLARIPVGNVIDVDPVIDDYATYVDPNTHTTVNTTFDWDWMIITDPGQHHGSGLTGVRVMPNSSIVNIDQGSNDNDVGYVNAAARTNGFEFTWKMWVVPAVWVAFDSNGGTPQGTSPAGSEYPTQRFQPIDSIPGHQHTYRAVKPAQDPTMAGKVFVGWYEVLLDSQGQEAGLASTPFDFSRVITYSRTLRAVYVDKPYYVHWMNGSTELEVDSVRPVDYPVYDGADPTKPDSGEFTYNFIGWDYRNPVVEKVYDPVYYDDPAQTFPIAENSLNKVEHTSRFDVYYYAVFEESIKTVPVTLLKVDEFNNPIEGVSFALEGAAAPYVTGADGKVSLGDLNYNSTQTLTETTPTGFIGLSGPATIAVNQNTGEVTVQTASQTDSVSVSGDATSGYTITVTNTHNVFYIFYSSTGKLEAVPMSSVGATGYDLFARVHSLHRYGGYYSIYGGATAENVEAAKANASVDPGVEKDVSNAVTYNGSSLKNGSNKFWDKQYAYRTDGRTLQPTAGTVYYLKEVPETFLCSRISYVYDYADNYNLVYFYLLTAIDDGNYSAVQFNVQTSNTNYPATIVSSFAITQRNSTTKFINKATDFTDLTRGYIAYADATNLLTTLQVGNSFTMTPQWITLDGVTVNGAARSFRFDSFTKTGIVDVTA